MWRCFRTWRTTTARRSSSHFVDVKREVDGYREQIAAKNVEIAELNTQIENVGKDAAVAAN